MNPTDRPDDLVGAVEGLPAFLCRVSPAGWSFRCTCGAEHTHSPREGRRAAHCDAHKARGYYVLPPEDDDAGSES